MQWPSVSTTGWPSRRGSRPSRRAHRRKLSAVGCVGVQPSLVDNPRSDRGNRPRTRAPPRGEGPAHRRRVGAVGRSRHLRAPRPGDRQVQAEVALGRRRGDRRRGGGGTCALPVWRATPADERAAILFRLADLLDAHAAEAAAINALDNGTPVSDDRFGELHRGVGALLRRLGRQARRAGRADVRGRPRSTTSCPSLRRRRRDPAVERPDAWAWARRRRPRSPRATPWSRSRRSSRRSARNVRRARARGRAATGRANVVPGGAVAGEALVRHPASTR